MTSLKSKQAIPPSGRDATKTTAQDGNSEILVKEEPPDMDEYLKSSDAFAKAHAKPTSGTVPPSGTPLVKLAQPGKALTPQVLKPTSGSSVASKPVVVIRKLPAGQLGAKGVPAPPVAAPKAIPGQVIVRPVLPVVKLVASTSVGIQRPVRPSVAQKLTTAQSKPNADHISGIVAKATSHTTTETVSLGLNSTTPVRVSVVANASTAKGIPEGSEIKRTASAVKKIPPSIDSKVSSPAVALKSGTTLNAANKCAASIVQKELSTPRTMSKSNSNVETVSQKSTSGGLKVPLQKTPAGSKPVADDGPTKGPVLRSRTAAAAAAAAVAAAAAATTTAAATAASTTASFNQNKQLNAGSKKAVNTDLSEVVIKTEPVDDYPESSATSSSTQLPLPSSGVTPASISPSQAASRCDGNTEDLVNSNRKLATLSQNAQSSESSVEVPLSVTDRLAAKTVESISSEQLPTTDGHGAKTVESFSSKQLPTPSDENLGPVISPEGDADNDACAVSSDSASDLANTENMNVDLSIVKNEPLEDQTDVELPAVSVHPVSIEEPSDDALVLSRSLNIRGDEVSATDDLNLAVTLNTLDETSPLGDDSNQAPESSGIFPRVEHSDVVAPIDMGATMTETGLEAADNVILSTEAVAYDDHDAVEQGCSVLPMDVDMSEVENLETSLNGRAATGPINQLSTVSSKSIYEITTESAIGLSRILEHSIHGIDDMPEAIFSSSETSVVFPSHSAADAHTVSRTFSPFAVHPGLSPNSSLTHETRKLKDVTRSSRDLESSGIHHTCASSIPRAEPINNDNEGYSVTLDSCQLVNRSLKSSEKLDHENIPSERSKIFSPQDDFEDANYHGSGNRTTKAMPEKRSIRRKRLLEDEFVPVAKQPLSSRLLEDEFVPVAKQPRSSRLLEDEFVPVAKQPRSSRFLEDDFVPVSKQPRSSRFLENEFVPVAKQPRSSSPKLGKENAASSATNYFNRERMSSNNNNSMGRKVLAANLSLNQEREHDPKKMQAKRNSEYLSVEMGSFLDEDLWSLHASPKPRHDFRAKKLKPKSSFAAEDRRRNFLIERHRKTVLKKSSGSRHSKKNLRMVGHFLDYDALFPSLSEFSRHSLDNCSWYISSCRIEDITASHRQDLMSDLNSVYIGKQPRFLLPPLGHLGGLSLETQLESQLIDLASVKSVFVEVVKEWVRKKPLHLFVNGQLKIEKTTYLPPKRASKINVVSDDCQKMFSHDICRMLADICELGESEDSLFPLPDGLSQFTTNRVFRKVKQYLRNYAKRLRRHWSLGKDSHSDLRIFQEDSILHNSRAKSKEKSSLSDYAFHLSLPSPDTVIRMQESKSISCQHFRSYQKNSAAPVATTFQPESEDATKNKSSSQKESITSLLKPVTFQPVARIEVDSPLDENRRTFDRLSSVHTRRLSMETSEPVKTSLSLAYDTFSKEADNICEEAGESSAANSVIDISKLYSPTRPTEAEEQETDDIYIYPAEGGPVSSKNLTAAEAKKESRIFADNVQSLDKEDGNIIPVLPEDSRNTPELISPGVQGKENFDEDEIEICVSHEESFTESDAEMIDRQKVVRSQVATVQDSKIAKKTYESSVKRKKRKSAKEKKPKKRRDKNRNEVCASPERDRPRKKRKYKHSTECGNKETEPSFNLESADSSVRPLQVCRASKSDAVYVDSYSSVVEDVINEVPVSNFEYDFDPTLPPDGHYRNPFRLSWSMLELFITKNTDALSKLIGIIPDVKKFNAKTLTPQRSFLWSLVLAMFDVARQEPVENENGKKDAEQTVVSQNLRSSVDEPLEGPSVGDDGLKRASVKGSNPLMQAFRQVVEAKRRLSKDSQKPKPASAVAKLSAELAARRAAPKSAKPLYRPSEMPQVPETVPPENTDANIQGIDDQIAPLVKEAVAQFYEELKKLLNEHDDLGLGDDELYILPCGNILDGNAHLAALSSLVRILYKSYEDCCKELFDQDDQLQEPEIVAVNDSTEIVCDDEASGDDVITLSSNDVSQTPSFNLEESAKVAADAVSSQLAEVCEEINRSVSLVPESRVEAVEAPVVEKEVKSKNAEEAVFEVAKTNLGPADRQYISSFPPLGPSKKKPKVQSQVVPRMIFAKLIGPALERLGSTSASAVSPATSEISTTTSASTISVATPVAVTSSADDVTIVASTKGVNNLPEMSPAVESSTVSITIGAPGTVETIALPSVTVSSVLTSVESNVNSSKAVTQSIQKATSVGVPPKISTSVASTSAATVPCSASSSIAKSTVVSSASLAQTWVSSAPAVSVSESVGMPSKPTGKLVAKDLPAPPSLPASETEMVPPPLPPVAFSQAETSASLAVDSSAYYQNAYPGMLSSASQAQDYMSSYYGYVGQPYDQSQSLVSSWMYDPNMHYAASAQVPFVDPAMMSYPPPMAAEQVPFFLPPTNQPPPFLPTPATGQLFPAYSSNPSSAQFSLPPPNMLPITVPPPSIPPSVPPSIPPSVPPSVPPPIMDTSVPPPALFPAAATLQTSVPPPSFNSFGMQWGQESSDPNNTPSVVPASSMPSVSSSNVQPTTVPSFSLEQQQQQADPLHSVREIIKFPPPPLPVSTTQVQQQPGMLTDHYTDNDQFSGQTGTVSQTPLQPIQESFQTKSSTLENSNQHQARLSSQGQNLEKRNDELQNQANSSKPNVMPSQETLIESSSKNDFDSRTQPWYSSSQQHTNVSGPQQYGPPQHLSHSQQVSKPESVSSEWSNKMTKQPSAGYGSTQQDSYESNIFVQNQGAKNGPGLNRPSGQQLIQPNEKPGQSTAQQIQRNPQSRQSGQEPRQFGMQQRPSGLEVVDSGSKASMSDVVGSSPAGMPTRPFGPRQSSSGLQAGHPGPETRHFGQMSSVRHSAPVVRMPTSEAKQLGSSRPGERKHDIPQMDFGARLRPESKQADQWARPSEVEPAQMKPSARFPGAHVRPSVPPDQRHVRPGMEPRHPVSEKNQDISFRRDADSGPSSGYPSRGSARSSMDSGKIDADKMRGDGQLRPPFNARPQLHSDLRQNRPGAPGDQRQSDPIQRFSAPQGDSSYRNAGPRGVTPLMTIQSKNHEDPKIRPLVNYPTRKSSDMSGQDPRNCSERGGGRVSAQSGLSNLRFCVFNTDRPICRAAEQFLLHSGARKFDPHNINALRAMPEIRCLLLVHKEDLRNVQNIPSLLRLKRDLRVTFVTFADSQDIQQRRFVTFFPRAGIMVMDMTALLACKSDVLDGICQFMTSQTVEKRTPWKLMLPSNVFNAIDFLKYKYEDDPEEHVRLAELSQSITAHKASGIVELLPEFPHRGQPRTTVEYQACCTSLQVNRLASFRHFLFITDMPRNHPDANLFLSNGIDVLNIPEFMRCFVSCSVEHRPRLHPPYITRVTMNKYIDSAISNAAECLGV